MERDPDQLFSDFLQQWAARQGCTFLVDAFDGRESNMLINGMAVDDVWGWLLPSGISEPSEDFFGCVVWTYINENLILTWKPNK